MSPAPHDPHDRPADSHRDAPALPEGRLVHSRVVEDPGEALAAALDRELTGYVRLEPQDALLLDADADGAVLVRSGVPVGVCDLAGGRAGPAALATLASPGPYSARLHELPADRLPLSDRARVPPSMPAERLAGDPDLADRTDRAAGRLDGRAGPDRDRASASGRSDAGSGSATGTPSGTASGASAGTDPGDGSAPGTGFDPVDATDTEVFDPAAEAGATSGDAVAAFLDDEQRIEAIRERARREARQRAREWGFEELVEEPLD